MKEFDPYQGLEMPEPYRLDLSKLSSGALGRWALQYEEFIRQIDAELARRDEVRIKPKPAKAGVEIEIVFP